MGRVPNRQKTSGIGDIEYIAYDYMHNLLQSTLTKKFKNKTPEYIAKAVLNDCGISVGKLAKTKTKISKYYPTEASPYNIIMGAYIKAKKKTKTEYMPRMNGTKFEVVEKGTIVKGDLEEKFDIYESNYEEDADGVVNKVVVFRNNKKVGTYKNKDSIKKYGTIQQAISVDSGKGKTEAKNTLKGVSKTVSISAKGNWNCIAGYGVYIKDSLAGLKGLYWIQNDTHSFENGIHTMQLDLVFKNKTEKIDVSTNSNSKKNSAGDKSGAKTRKVEKNATFTAYYPTKSGAKDAMGNKLNPARKTCAGARSLSFGTKVKIGETGTSYDGKTYKVTDRPAKDMLKGKVHIDILMNSEAECKAFGVRSGTITWTKKSNPGPSSKADKVADVAKSYIGKVKYVFGAASPQNGKSDCSGFTQYCFSKVGLSIGRDTLAQAKQGTEVKKNKLRKGDLVFFKGTYRAGISHVGIMIDNKNFVHCSSGAHNVTTSNLNSSYYMQHYATARRVV